MTAEISEKDPFRISLKAAGEKLSRANAERTQAMLELVGHFKAAREHGVSITEAHKLTGLSRQSLHKISKKLNAVHCSNPECPNAGRCGGECARNF